MATFPGGRLIPLGTETTFILLAPEKMGRQKERRTINDIAPTACLQLGLAKCTDKPSALPRHLALNSCLTRDCDDGAFNWTRVEPGRGLSRVECTVTELRIRSLGRHSRDFRQRPCPT
jgi:hypothetical protein